MKLLNRVLVAAASCLVLSPFAGEAANDSPFHRNVWVRKIVGNATGISVSSRIHGGAEAREGQFKYMLFLLSYGTEHYFPGSTCSASLIHPSWVLTAAHCVSSAMIAVAGRANLYSYWREGRRITPFSDEIDERRFGVQERKVRRAFVHPGYSTTSYEKDLALLLLDRPFDMDPYHWAPVAVLPLAASEMNTKMKCTSMGWGLNDHAIQTFKLMFASEIYAATPAFGCHYLQKGPFICLEEGGPGICKGDSGSPLVCHDMAWGVASFSLSSDANSDCFSTNEEYYSQIFPELDWIQKTMKNAATPAATPFTCFAIGFAIVNLVITLSSRSPIEHL